MDRAGKVNVVCGLGYGIIAALATDDASTISKFDVGVVPPADAAGCIISRCETTANSKFQITNAFRLPNFEAKTQYVVKSVLYRYEQSVVLNTKYCAFRVE